MISILCVGIFVIEHFNTYQYYNWYLHINWNSFHFCQQSKLNVVNIHVFQYRLLIWYIGNTYDIYIYMMYENLKLNTNILKMVRQRL